jgi:hypothetical protein
MKVLFIFLACFAVLTPVASAQSDIKLEIGAKLPRRYVPRRIKELMGTGPTQARPFIRKNIGGIEYYIAFEEKTRKIKYISTSDKNFYTMNGLHFGSEIIVTRDQLTIYPQWYIFAPATPDGWIPILDPLSGEEGNLRTSLSKLKGGEKTTIRIVSFIKSGDLK